MLKLLRQTNFALFWTSGLVSAAGDWVLFTALPFFVYHLTGSPLATGAMFVAQTLPSLLWGPVGGVYADRWNRQQVMIVADILRGIVLLPLLLVRSAESVWIVYVVGFLEVSITQFAAPAETAILPTLVPETDLAAANSLNAMNDNLARLAGPALGGAAMATYGLPTVVMLDVASYVVSALLIAFLKPPVQAAALREHATIWGDWLAAMALVARRRPLAVLFGVTATAVVAEGVLTVLLVPFVKDLLGGGAADFGWLMTARGVGGIAGGLLVGMMASVLRPEKMLSAGLAGCGAILLAMVYFRSLWAGLALLVLVGIPGTAFIIGAQTLLQTNAPDEFRGRISGSFGTTLALASLAGMALGSTLGAPAGVAAMFSAAGFIYLVSAVTAWIGFRRQWNGAPKQEARVPRP